MSQDEVDARFRSLIETEFGSTRLDALSAASPVEPEPRPADPEPAPVPPRSWTPAEELDDGSGYKPDPLPPAGRLSSTAWLGIGLLGAGLVVIVGMLLDLLGRWWGVWAGFGGVGLGILVLFSRLPRDRDDDGSGGAVV
ncbi:MAG: hypothetical protein Q4G45_10965 [Actinomycetia bacterium]|nr:hypothetical protein [Actinomycetes bacterium]